MKIAILGAGALGCYYGARLAAAGEDVTFIMRSGYEKCNVGGLHIQSEKGDLTLPQPKLAPNAASCGPVDLVLLCWKSTVNAALAQELPHLLHEETLVATLQNGMGNAELLATLLPAERIFIGLCFICAMMPEAGHIIHTGPDKVRFAPHQTTEDGLAQAEKIADLFQASNIPSNATLHAEQVLWGKLSWNIPFNGLCLAHGGISIGELFKMPEEVLRAERIMQEVCAVAAARGYPLSASLVEQQMESTASMDEFVPSSALDYRLGRPVEYAAIWGISLQRAHEAGVSVPAWKQLAADIRQRLDLHQA